MYRFLLTINTAKVFHIQKLIVVFLLFCSTVSCVRNNKCSRQSVAIARKDTFEKEIRHIYDPDSLLTLYDKSLSEGNMVKQMVLCGKYAKVMRDMSDFSSSIKYNLIGLDIAKELNDTMEMVRHYNSLGTNFRRLGAFAEAMGYHSTAMELIEMFSDSTSASALKNKAVTYNGMGNISLTMGYGNEAKKFFEQALSKEQLLGSHLGQAINYSNIGAIFHENNMYDSAMWYYNRSMQENVMAKSNIGISLCYESIGSVYEDLGRLDKAEEAYTKSYEAICDDKDMWHKMQSYISIGRINIKQKRFDKAKRFLDEALVVIRDMGSLELMADVDDMFYRYYKAIGNPEKALYFFEQSNTHKDSVSGEQEKNSFMEICISFEKLRNQRKEAILKEHNIQQRIRSRYITILSCILTALLLTVIILLVHLQKNEKRRADILNDMNNIKNKFFSIISHDLRNTAISINRSVKILADNSPNMSATDCKNFLNELSLTTDTQVELLESLLEWAKIETGKMEFCPAAYDIGQIFELVEKQLYKLLKDKRISIKSNIADEVCVEADFNMISIVIRNILSNAIKFSYPDSVIDVVVTEIGSDKVLVEIKDYGIGMTEQDIADCFRLDRSVSIKGTAGEVGTGLGLVVCREMLGKHNSVLNITSQRGKGSVFSFTLNKSIKPQ